MGEHGHDAFHVLEVGVLFLEDVFVEGEVLKEVGDCADAHGKGVINNMGLVFD